MHIDDNKHHIFRLSPPIPLATKSQGHFGQAPQGPSGPPPQSSPMQPRLAAPIQVLLNPAKILCTCPPPLAALPPSVLPPSERGAAAGAEQYQCGGRRLNGSVLNR